MPKLRDVLVQAQAQGFAPTPQPVSAGPAGQLEPGNIDLTRRPIVRNADGSISTVRSMSANFDGQEVLVPTVSDDGRVMSDDEALNQYRQTGQHLGKFNDPTAATAYAEQLHRDQEARYASAGAGATQASAGGAPRTVKLRDVLTAVSKPPATPAAPAPARASAKPAAPQRTTGQKIAREVGGLGLRNVVEGTADLLGIFYDPIADGVNWLSRKPQTTKTLITGQQEHYIPRQARAREISDMLLDGLGVPKPETAQERVSGDVGRALTGTALTMGAGGLVNALRGAGTAAAPSIVPMLTEAAAPNAVPATSRAVSNFLLADPALQVASTAAGSAAAGTAREAGLGPGAQAVAGILGGMSPGVASGLLPGMRASGSVPAAVAAVTKNALRGRDSAGKKLTADDIQRTIRDFEAGGTTGSVGQIGQSRIGQAAETVLSNVPGGAGPTDRFGRKQAREVAERIDQLAAELTPRGSRVDEAQVGRAIVKGVEGDGGFKQRTRDTAGRLYDELDKFIAPTDRVQVDNAAKALPEINPAIPGAPNLSPLFQNARIKRIEGALQRDAWGNEAVATRPGVADQIDDARGTLKEQASDIGRLNDDTAAAIAQQNVLRTSLGQKPLEHVPYPVMGRKDIDDEIQTLLAGKADGRLPFEALKKLRTAVGQELDNAGLMADVPRSKWRALYSALSKDMQGAAEEAGPQAIRAWTRADNYYQARIKRLESIEHVIDRHTEGAGVEGVFQAATGNLKWGSSTLNAIMKSLPRESQKELTAMVLRRMGRAVGSQQNAETDKFSMSTFLTNWANTSKSARRALFDRHGPNFSQNMDRIARMAERVRDGSEVFRNPSGTVRQGALMAQTVASASGAAASLAMGNVAGAVISLGTSAASAATANKLAKVMTDPKWVAWLASNTNKPVGELLSQLQVISRVGEKDGNADIVEAAAALREAATQQTTEKT